MISIVRRVYGAVQYLGTSIDQFAIKTDPFVNVPLCPSAADDPFSAMEEPTDPFAGGLSTMHDVVDPFAEDGDLAITVKDNGESRDKLRIYVDQRNNPYDNSIRKNDSRFVTDIFKVEPDFRINNRSFGTKMFGPKASPPLHLAPPSFISRPMPDNYFRLPGGNFSSPASIVKRDSGEFKIAEWQMKMWRNEFEILEEAQKRLRQREAFWIRVYDDIVIALCLVPTSFVAAVAVVKGNILCRFLSDK